MENLKTVLRQMIEISESELDAFTEKCLLKVFKKNELLNQPQLIPNEVFFISKGLIRVIVIDKEGSENTIHFAMENQFIADYSSFIQQIPSVYSLQALEVSEVIIMPRKVVEWGYQNLGDGQKLGRLIAEFYFIYNDFRIKNLYALSPKERYDCIADTFPNIHNRVPQHMIASYLGITPVHLSRLKKTDYAKS
jgi:signal-transduction protein with cAMP-binding, CBS, and nucleotidyltransferase domain